MNRRTFGLAVRLLAVVAAIYAFFSLRSQVNEQKTVEDRQSIPVQVIQPVCGWLTLEKISKAESEPPAELESIIRKAAANPGMRIEVSHQGECSKLEQMHGSSITTKSGAFRIQFHKRQGG